LETKRHEKKGTSTTIEREIEEEKKAEWGLIAQRQRESVCVCVCVRDRHCDKLSEVKIRERRERERKREGERVKIPSSLVSYSIFSLCSTRSHTLSYSQSLNLLSLTHSLSVERKKEK
jgi:hypothetical protein